MDRFRHSQEEYERHEYLKDLEETHFFDAASGIYKPKSCKPIDENQGRPETNCPHGPALINCGGDSFLSLCLSFFSAFTLFATLVVVGIYTYASWGQWEEMRTATIATGKAAAAAKDSADAAKGANGLTVKTMHFDQRAWVGVSSQFVTVKDIGVDSVHGLSGNMSIPIKNSGKTPAFAVMPMAQFETDVSKLVEDSKRSCDLLLPYIKPVTPKSNEYFPPDILKHRWGRMLFPSTEQDISVGSGDRTPVKPSVVYAVGCVVYRDIFREIHWTRFCYESRRLLPPDRQPIEIFEQCNTNNYTDEAYPEDRQ
jgi:hypothetical protein